MLDYSLLSMSCILKNLTFYLDLGLISLLVPLLSLKFEFGPYFFFDKFAPLLSELCNFDPSIT